MYLLFFSGLHLICFQVASLFDDHPDLLDEFTRFLPDTSATPSTHLVGYGRASFPRISERASGTPTLRQMHMDKVVALYIVFCFSFLFSLFPF